MYYESNSAKLFMGDSTATPLPAPVADTFAEVPLTGSVTPPANVLSSAYFNVTNDAQRRSLGGKLGDQTVEGSLVIDWDAPVHAEMYANSKKVGGQKRNWYLEYANGRRLDFVGFLSSWTEEPLEASDDAQEHRANFVISIDGGVTATPAVVP